jgi:BTB/POZ domain-containing protein 9
LKFIYTGQCAISVLYFTGFVSGTITVTSNVGLILEVMGLAHQYSFKDLENATIRKLISSLNVKNICSIFNTANLYDMSDLKQACHTFMDQNASEIVTGDCFTDLSQVTAQ